MLTRLRAVSESQLGVAMVTVLMIAAALTAVASGAAYVTIQELGATRADSTAAQSLAYAEAGIDRLMLEIRKGTLTWNNISRAGCDVAHPKIEVTGTVAPGGTYVAQLEVFNRFAAVPADRFIPAACASATAEIRKGTVRSFMITSTGSQPAARRVVRQIIDIKPLGLPVGIYAYDRIDADGNVNLDGVSMITEGVVTKRQQIAVRGTDPYYVLADFYGSRGSATIPMPAAVHAKGAIDIAAGGKPENEHRPGSEPNCSANKTQGGSGTVGQSLWDGSGTAVLDPITTGCPTWPGSPGVPSTTMPPTSKFTEEDRLRVAPTPNLSEQDYLTLREAAKQNGLYCIPSGATGNANANNLSCSEGGTAFRTVTGDIAATDFDHPNIPRAFVAFFDFRSLTTNNPLTTFVKWGANVGPCNTDPALNRSVVIVVRNGSFDSAGGGSVNGALLIPEGKFESTGNFTLTGTVIARQFTTKGTITVSMTPCWINNLPGPFLDVFPVGWSEVDR